MLFDLSVINPYEEITKQFKKQHFDNVSKLVESNSTDNTEKNMVTVFHGTSLYHLNSILINGLVPRKFSEYSNFEVSIESNPNLVYLTNKWHYFYAYNVTRQLLEEGKEMKDLNIPCYVECRVPAKNLVIDEDFFHSHYMKNRIKKAIKQGKTMFDVSFQECLSQYATIAHLGEVPRENIISFTLLVNQTLFNENFVNSKSQYQKELDKWAKGKGKGSLDLLDLARLENHEDNATFWIENIPKNHIITGLKPTNNKNVSYGLQISQVK